MPYPTDCVYGSTLCRTNPYLASMTIEALLFACNERDGRKHSIHSLIRIRHGADYLRIREYAENTVFIYQYGSDMALTIYGSGIMQKNTVFI
jgi:hypothetical protein